MIQVAVMGYGTIGSGVVEVLETNREIIKRKTGQDISVKYILDLREFPGDPHEDLIVHDFSTIEKDPDVGIVVEAMGGVKPAWEAGSRLPDRWFSAWQENRFWKSAVS